MKPLDVLSKVIGSSRKKIPKKDAKAKSIPAPFGKESTNSTPMKLEPTGPTQKKKNKTSAKKVQKEKKVVEEDKDEIIKRLQAELAAAKKKKTKQKQKLSSTQDSEYVTEEEDEDEQPRAVSSPAKRTRSQVSLEDQAIREVGMKAVAETLQELGKTQDEVFYKNKRARSTAKL